MAEKGFPSQLSRNICFPIPSRYLVASDPTWKSFLKLDLDFCLSINLHCETWSSQKELSKTSMIDTKVE